MTFNDLISSSTRDLRNQFLVKIYKFGNTRKYVLEKSAKKPLKFTGKFVSQRYTALCKISPFNPISPRSGTVF